MDANTVNAQWKSQVNSIDAQIANYKEALMARGVPEGKWLNDTLAAHRAGMLEQAGYDLDVASGHKGDTTNRPGAYKAPADYGAFYDGLAAQYRAQNGG